VVFLIYRSEIVLWSALRDDLEIECACGGSAHACTNTGEDNLMDVGELDKGWLLGNKKDIFFEQE
jgi:hypothetical protein